MTMQIIDLSPKDKCDFCSAQPVKWSYACKDFDTGMGMSRGEWLACDVCHDLIEDNKWKELAARSEATQPNRDRIPQDLREDTKNFMFNLHKKFSFNRLAQSATPYEPEQVTRPMMPKDMLQAVKERLHHLRQTMPDDRKIQKSEDGYIPIWTTQEMCKGEETVQQHLMAPDQRGVGHGLTAELVDKLSISECHRLHDKLHEDAGDNDDKLMEYMLLRILGGLIK